MICENCQKEIEGNFIRYQGHCFCRHDNDACIKEWLYDQTDGECEYGTVVNGDEYDIEPSWSEPYLNSLGMSMRDFL